MDAIIDSAVEELAPVVGRRRPVLPSAGPGPATTGPAGHPGADPRPRDHPTADWVTTRPTR